MKTPILAPSLLSADFSSLKDAIQQIENNNGTAVHIDVMDGKFVERDTQELMKDYALTISHISNLGLDVHFMVKNVEKLIDEYAMYVNWYVGREFHGKLDGSIYNTVSEGVLLPNGETVNIFVEKDLITIKEE